MLHHTGTLWQHLGSFILYTLFAIGMIYAAYYYARKHSGNLLGGLGEKIIPGGKMKLEVESSLSLEPRKTLYVVRAGAELFLLSPSMEGTQFLSRLESVESPVALPSSQVIGAM